MSKHEFSPRRGAHPSHLRVNIPPRVNAGSLRSSELSQEEISVQEQKVLENLNKTWLEIYAPGLHRFLRDLLGKTGD